MTELAITDISAPLAIHNTPIASTPNTPIPAKPPLVRDIIRIVASYYHSTPQELTGRSRQRIVLRPRYMAIYLAHKLTGRSSTFIGRHTGRRDHTTILATINKMRARLEVDLKLVLEYQYLHDKIVAEYGL